MDSRRFDDLVRQLAKGTSRRSVIKGLTGSIAGMLTGGAIASRRADAAPAPKVTICHFTSSQTNPYEIITISSNALEQHQTNHGDNLFGDCCLDSDCAVPDGVQCAVAVCQADASGTSWCGLAPTPGATCDDGIDCTVDDVCGAAVNECAGTPVDSRCDDGNACTTDICEVGVGCTYGEVDCDDGNACTTDSCDPAQGCVYETVNCDDGDACTTETCSPAVGCVYADVFCDDGDICTINECDSAIGCVFRPIDGCCHADEDCPRGQICVDNTCTDDPNPECAGQTCGTFEFGCNNNPNCACASVAEGGGFCTFDVSCGGLAPCPGGSTDCPVGQLCIVDSCCVSPVCVPTANLCPVIEGFAPANFTPTKVEGQGLLS